MSRALRSRRSKRNTDRKAARPAPFDPAVFLETTAIGRVISTHSNKDVIFAQGDGAVADRVGNRFGAISGNFRVAGQAARSIGWSMSLVAKVCQPSTLRMLI